MLNERQSAGAVPVFYSAFSIQHSAFASMGLIKAHQSPANLQPFSMADVEAAAKRILLRARQQAEQLLFAAQQEAEGLKELAREEGLREGREQGYAEGMQK